MTSPLGALSTLLRREDLAQLLIGLFALLTFVAIIMWPSDMQDVNNSWYTFAQVKVAALAFLGLTYGSVSSTRTLSEQRLTLAALGCFHILTLPLETATYAASYPSTPLWWPLLVCAADIVAFFGVGLVLGTLCSRLRLRALLPLAIPLVLVGVVSFDVWVSVWVGQPVLNPFTAVTAFSAVHLAVAGSVAAATLTFLVRKSAIETDARPHVH